MYVRSAACTIIWLARVNRAMITTKVNPIAAECLKPDSQTKKYRTVLDEVMQACAANQHSLLCSKLAWC